jgi:hypothetical protein
MQYYPKRTEIGVKVQKTDEYGQVWGMGWKLKKRKIDTEF